MSEVPPGWVTIATRAEQNYIHDKITVFQKYCVAQKHFVGRKYDFFAKYVHKIILTYSYTY